MENQLTIKNASGADETIEVMDIVLDNETGKRYIFYHLLDSEDIYAAILREADTTYFLEAISDDSEWEIVEEILKNQIKAEGGSNEAE